MGYFAVLMCGFIIIAAMGSFFVVRESKRQIVLCVGLVASIGLGLSISEVNLSDLSCFLSLILFLGFMFLLRMEKVNRWQKQAQQRSDRYARLSNSLAIASATAIVSMIASFVVGWTLVNKVSHKNLSFR